MKRKIHGREQGFIEIIIVIIAVILITGAWYLYLDYQTRKNQVDIELSKIEQSQEIMILLTLPLMQQIQVLLTQAKL